MRTVAVRTEDADFIKEVITSPGLWPTVAEDGHNPEDYIPDTERGCWLSIIHDGQFIGLYYIHAHNTVLAEIHAHILPECRKEFSFPSGGAALYWIYEYAPQYQKIIANVPRIYENVKNFTAKFGFVVEGVNRKSYLKNGELHDQWLLGITRDEIKGFLNEQCN